MTGQEKIICRSLELYLDEHPEKEVVIQLHCVDGEWRHVVEIRDKNIAKF